MDAIPKDSSDVGLMSSNVVEIHECTHIWTIDNFSKTFSETFSNAFDSAMNTKWRMTANSRHLPNGSRSFGLFVQNSNKEVSPIISFVKCNVFITNIYGKDVCLGSKKICILNNLTKILELCFEPIAEPKFGFVSRQKLNLVIKFEIRSQKSCKTFGTERKQEFFGSDKIVPMGSRSVGDGRKWRLTNNAKSKLVFLVNSKTFFVNRNLITTKSKVIERAVTEHTESDTFRLNGISSETFEEVLYFFNFGKVRDLKQRAVALLIAAKDFEVEHLAVVCLEFIAENLSVDNVIKHLKLAKSRNLDDLMKKVLVFVDKNYNQLKDKKDWTQNFGLILKVGKNFLSQNSV